MIESSNGPFDWFKWGGKYSDEFGTVVENMTVSARPDRNVQRIPVIGRDGDLTISDDTYGTIPVTITCHWPADMSFELVNAWLSGKSDLILSHKADQRYKAEVSGVLNYQNLGVYWRADIVMVAQPFDYEANPEVLELTASQTIYHPGTRWSLPVITVYGAGTLTIGGYTMTVTATAGEGHVVINSEIGECYYAAPGGGLTYRGNKVAVTDPDGKVAFPVLHPGEIDITISAGITKVEIQGNWRWF
jgi:phage-related protein